MFITEWLQHRKDCKLKQDERHLRVKGLVAYNTPVTTEDREIFSAPITTLVSHVRKRSLPPFDLLRAYGRVALRAHARTNCLTEIMIPSAEGWIADGSINLDGPLAGIPVSIKDTLHVAGYDSSTGYSSFVGNAPATDGPVVRLLKDAGAVPYVKTNLPITLLSFESTNDVWGRCTNPHVEGYSPGGSSGGEGALIALGGRVGLGTDVAGSVRIPAHFSGIYTLRCSTGRFPKVGGSTSMAGQEGVPAVVSPMARTLKDLTYFTRSVISMRPWRYEHTVHPIPWRDDEEKAVMQKPKLRIGVLNTDGVVDPSPAVERALLKVATALRNAGHELVPIDPPSPYEGLVLAANLLNNDGCQTFASHIRPGERNDPGAERLLSFMRLPRLVKWAYHLWVKYVRRDPVWAGLVRDWHPKTTAELWSLVARREAYRARWFDWWEEEKFDFLITPPFPTPAVPHGAMWDAVSACNYTFLFNLLDYSAGIVPITHVDKETDGLPADFNLRKLNGVSQGVYKFYDATKMHGLPVGVQVVGRRLEEEKVLAAMQRIEDALGLDTYQPLELD